MHDESEACQVRHFAGLAKCSTCMGPTKCGTCEIRVRISLMGLMGLQGHRAGGG